MSQQTGKPAYQSLWLNMLSFAWYLYCTTYCDIYCVLEQLFSVYQFWCQLYFPAVLLNSTALFSLCIHTHLTGCCTRSPHMNTGCCFCFHGCTKQNDDSFPQTALLNFITTLLCWWRHSRTFIHDLANPGLWHFPQPSPPPPMGGDNVSQKSGVYRWSHLHWLIWHCSLIETAHPD
jgi:hypothetical protein